jgi:hypothetical protein
MNTIVMAVALFSIIVQTFVVVAYPLLLGKKREPYSMKSWWLELVAFILNSILCGRVFGWW